ncbi:hypothetical protein O6P43_026745 [Quillaja saponaria]|uniref:Uncharacterized protein n=1 Tax=Quillaja saponaria TaxID=32244 RepID=A0AAD7L399_QUISA|nr:hypothetical protein O6P43_026745 [Quillaja saponaria]
MRSPSSTMLPFLCYAVVTKKGVSIFSPVFALVLAVYLLLVEAEAWRDLTGGQRIALMLSCFNSCSSCPSPVALVLVEIAHPSLALNRLLHVIAKGNSSYTNRISVHIMEEF